MKKCICISIPCYNEEENIALLVDAIENEFKINLSHYDYEIHFIDNASTDNTKNILRNICKNNKKVKAILNGKNFRLTSKFYGILQTNGDCTISMVADFQDPVSMITPMVRKWEEGYKVVLGVKDITEENIVMASIRKFYYKFMKKFSRVEQIENFNGFGLYDRSFIEFLREIKDPMPSFRGLVSEYGYRLCKLPYQQSKRKFGKSKNKLINLYNTAIINFVSYTKVGIRFFTLLGVIVFSVTLIAMFLKSVTNLYFKSINFVNLIIIWISSIQIIFIGILGEYILEMNYRLLKRPWVIEEERLNYD